MIDNIPNCVHELFGSRARVASTDIAIEVLGGYSLTCGQVHTESSAAAKRLNNMGLGPEVVVGLSIDEGLFMVLAQLAVLMSGAAFVPIDLSLPHRRIVSMIKQSGMRHLICISKSAEQEQVLNSLSVSAIWAEDLFPMLLTKATSIPSGKRPAPCSGDAMETSPCDSSAESHHNKRKSEQVNESVESCVCESSAENSDLASDEVAMGIDSSCNARDVDIVNEETPACPEAKFEVSVHPHNLCWIFFTSGDPANM